MNQHYCPYHDADHLTERWECPEPPGDLPAYVGWSDAGKGRAAARMTGTLRIPGDLPDPMLEGVGIDDVGWPDDEGRDG